MYCRVSSTIFGLSSLPGRLWKGPTATDTKAQEAIMKGISKTAHAGFSPLIPAVLVPPEVFTQAPPGFIPPPLNPSGARLETKELAPGVYGLLSSKRSEERRVGKEV